MLACFLLILTHTSHHIFIYLYLCFVCRINKPERFRACLQHFLAAEDEDSSSSSEDAAGASVAVVDDDIYDAKTDNSTGEEDDDVTPDEDNDVTPDEDDDVTPDEDDDVTPDEDEGAASTVVVELPSWEVCPCMHACVCVCVSVFVLTYPTYTYTSGRTESVRKMDGGR